jgi:ribosomal protein S18 acetylase RimI-like enzyme
MSEALTVRVAVPDDDRELADLDARSWPAHLQVVAPQPADQPFFTDWRRPVDVLVASADGAVLGYARLARHMRIASNDHVLHLDALVVAPEARGRGVGGALLDAAVVEAQRRNITKLGLRVLSTNPTAMRLYQRHGFAEEARLQAEFARPDGSFADDVWMVRWL